MTTAAATDGTRGAERGPGTDPLASLASPPGIAMAVVLVAAFVLLFQNWLFRQVRLSIHQSEDWGHALLVPVISGYLLWQRRDVLREMSARVFWPGLAPMLLGIVSYCYFIVLGNHMAQGFAIVLTAFGMVLLLAGPQVMQVAFMPIAYLGFAVTIAQKIMIMVTFKLQMVAAQGAWVILNIVGVNTDIAGNVITVIKGDGTELPLNVAEQCSGMRTVVSFLALGTAVALVACRHWWQRVAVILLAIPVAILVNVGRVVVLGLLSLVNPDLAVGQAHTFIGTLLLVPGFLLFMGIVWALNRSVRDDASVASGGAS